MGGKAGLRPAARAEPRRADMELRRRPDHREQPDGRPPLLGPDPQGRLPALQGAPGFRPALPERLRLPGALGRGERRAPARAQLEARDRGLRARGVRREVQAVGGRVLRGDHRPVQAPRHVDGLGQRLLHVLGHEHRVHLALPEDGARARVALHGAPLERLVPALRNVHLPARADRFVRGPERPVALRAPAAPRRRRGCPRRLDDDALDVACERRRRRRSRGRVREALDCRRPALGGGGAASRASVRRRGRRQGEGGGPRRQALRGPVRPPCRRRRGRAPRHPVGRRDDGGRHRHRPHRAGLRHRGLRALRASTTSPCSCPSTRPAASTTPTAGCTAPRQPRRRTRSSATSASAGACSRPARSSTATPSAGAVTRRSSSASSTSGSSPATRFASRCWKRTRR